MTIVVTRNSPPRFRGFLASCMCEIAPGVYSSPRMNDAVRRRIWAVLEDWYEPAPEHAVLMTWRDTSLPGGQAIRVLGAPRQDLWDHDGVFLARRPLPDEPAPPQDDQERE
ncbi:MAG TPA: type I-E CRISPR-associated endoribonuclease Cas2e [Acidobacteriota bacterium]|nr:type I-E CRISPR-associated endoribonuclease Cas2e [Acidobacteriota bacterium]